MIARSILAYVSSLTGLASVAALNCSLRQSGNAPSNGFFPRRRSLRFQATPRNLLAPPARWSRRLSERLVIQTEESPSSASPWTARTRRRRRIRRRRRSMCPHARRPRASRRRRLGGWTRGIPPARSPAAPLAPRCQSWSPGRWGGGTRSNARRSVARRSGTSRGWRRSGREAWFGAGPDVGWAVVPSHATAPNPGSESDARIPTGAYRRAEIFTARPKCPVAPDPAGDVASTRAEADPPGDTRPEGAMCCDGAPRGRESRDTPSGASSSRPRARNARFFRLAPNRKSV